MLFPIFFVVDISQKEAESVPLPFYSLVYNLNWNKKEGVMVELNSLFQSADWKAEKHVPVIEAPAETKKGAFFTVTVTVGKEIPHPNTTAHHIRWIALYFMAEGDKFPYELARTVFSAHGESTQGADTGGVYTDPKITVTVKADRSGRLLSSSYCNIHGLWQSSSEISII
jgi:superoxide reductase